MFGSVSHELEATHRQTRPICCLSVYLLADAVVWVVQVTVVLGAGNVSPVVSLKKG